MDVPASIVWISKVLRTLPSPTGNWVALIDALVWPVVVVFLVLRFRRFLRLFLDTLLERFQTDHIKTPLFELTPGSPVVFLDPVKVDESTEDFSPDDIQRIERIFESLDEPEGFSRIDAWLNEKYRGALSVEDFATDPKYANAREAAFTEIEGLKQ